MTPRPPLLTLLASLIVHGVALSLLFVFASGESRPSALLVDLSEPETVRDGAGWLQSRDPARGGSGCGEPVAGNAAEPAFVDRGAASRRLRALAQSRARPGAGRRPAKAAGTP